MGIPVSPLNILIERLIMLFSNLMLNATFQATQHTSTDVNKH